jgi:dsDNA-specific endonuclease/ATPase MutS2
MPGILGLIQTTSFSIADVLMLIGLTIGGLVAWRSKRGDFYKAVAEEKTAEAERLLADNARMHHLTDLTPLRDSQQQIADALERHGELLSATMAKLSDLNGSLRALTTANEALAQKLITDEASRALLREASEPAVPRRRRA